MEYPEYPGKTVAVGAPCLHLTLVSLVTGAGLMLGSRDCYVLLRV